MAWSTTDTIGCYVTSKQARITVEQIIVARKACGAIGGRLSIFFQAHKLSLIVALHICQWNTKCGTVWTVVVFGALHSEAHVKS